jgi:pimeloyl-ACP methyl ester carboxylesterase
MIPLRDLCKSDPAEANNRFASLISGTEGATGFMSSVCSKPVPQERAVELLANFNANSQSRADSVKFIAGADCQTTTLDAASRFAGFTHPVTVVWGDGDKIFPLSDGERLAKDFPNANLVRV